MATSIDSLPQHTLHYILSLLSQEEAVQTSLLSKSWRHLWYGRPKVEFCESEFTNKQTSFLSVVDNTLQRYIDQRLPLKELCLKFSEDGSVGILEKWIPVMMLRSLGVQKLQLCFVSKLEYFMIPVSVFSISESLKELSLEGYNLNSAIHEKVFFKHLQLLFLKRVHIADETFEKIVTSCPLIESVFLENCEGFQTIKIENKHLELFILVDLINDEDDCCSIRDINAPNIENIVIAGCWNWFYHHNNFPHLKALVLQNVQLSTNSLDIFSSNFPCLEKLKLSGTYGYEQLQLSCRSIRSIAIEGLEKSTKVITIDAPNILYFEFESFFLPSSFSFATTAGHDWKSKIRVTLGNDLASTSQLTKLLKAVSQSKISLDLHYDPLLGWDIADLCQGVIANFYSDGYNIQRVIAVEHLILTQDFRSNSIPDSFLNFVFRIIRPRYTYAADAEQETVDLDLIKSLYERLVHGSSKQDLEQTSIEASEDNETQWHPVQGLPECALSTGQKIRFRLTWREIS